MKAKVFFAKVSPSTSVRETKRILLSVLTRRSCEQDHKVTP